MAARRPYVRGMDGWWNRVPFFQRYMAREVTAFFVALYGLVMLAGLVRLAQGPEAYAQWLELLRSGWSIALHVVLLLVFVYHTYSWFEIMPKTMPPVVVGGKKLAPQTITGLGLAAAGAASAFVLLVAWMLAR
ncbi:MAG TPA: fumarate reductase subunit C [Ramlibacter sp.]|uniref:fumarate reductase subunit C n=1 Tax=Ramlibacter sp. TaxID=1917967 RepID=UPI002D809BE0|nr:fumarate reductase subunit C [Ramlibacter sp.]HET8745751.1 fumarate reductase subunit C [Ramlibacter sp.]